MTKPKKIVPYYPIQRIILGERAKGNFEFVDPHSFNTLEEADDFMDKSLNNKTKERPETIILTPEEVSALNENLANYLFVTGREFFPGLHSTVLVSLMAALHRVYQK